ncbi:methyltransferase domain-containing protein [Nocardiopsis ganjiahuensis]|uniref:methyltransferase domain-containing protein n=1 Tax=Nocardiopsis ganjiahuensis TaxID=239984 RepID=UPI000362DE68|nr:methyltransferase domain-containing protein [Nocardiopsis ganjiahuensis]
MTARERNSALIEAIIADGTLTDAALVEAFRSVPRHLFIPETGALTANGSSLNAAGNPDRWLAAVYTDNAIVTRVEGPEVPRQRQPGRSVSTSCSSAPTVLARMLELADLANGQRVLEVGTGTGWNTALLAHRLGDAAVTSVEIDEPLLYAARGSLREAGLSPATHLTDGHSGYPEAAPFDRIISACGVRRVPGAWLDQLTAGGLVVCPWGMLESAGVLMRLELGPAGTESVSGAGPKAGPGRTALGRFHGGVGFVPLRTPGSALPPVRDAGQQPDEYRLTQVDPVAPMLTFASAFAVSVMVPDWRMRRRWIGTGSGMWLCDRRGDSWVRIYPYGTSWMIEQGGPRSIWDEVEAALVEWSSLGEPDPDRFGLVVESDGAQRVWLDSPDGRSWPVGSPV